MGTENIAPPKLFIDGKEITNFFTDDIQVIEPGEENCSRLMKRFEFEGTITLNKKQTKRLIKRLVKAERKWKWEQFKKKFKNVTHLFKMK